MQNILISAAHTIAEEDRHEPTKRRELMDTIERMVVERVSAERTRIREDQYGCLRVDLEESEIESITTEFLAKKGRPLACFTATEILPRKV